MSNAWLFPGQGSHCVGMAGAWCRAYPVAAETLTEAGEVLGFDLAGLIKEGPAEVLDDTYNQQPAILAASVAILRAATAAGVLTTPVYVAGHSLGEFSALVAADVLDYRQALDLVRERGRLMRQAGTTEPGKMLAVLGLEDDVVAACAEQAGVQVANFNAPGQVVISGAADLVDDAAVALRAVGAKRLVPLPITIAAHSALMSAAGAAFRAAMADVRFAAPSVPVVVNRTGEPVTDPALLRDAVAGQLTAPVRWSHSVQRMLADGVTTFQEIGPGDVLSGLVRRIARSASAEAITATSLSEPPS